MLFGVVARNENANVVTSQGENRDDQPTVGIRINEIAITLITLVLRASHPGIPIFHRCDRFSPWRFNHVQRRNSAGSAALSCTENSARSERGDRENSKDTISRGKLLVG